MKMTKDGTVCRVRCAIGHSGNTRITHAPNGYYACVGCGHFFSRDVVHAASRGPVRGTHGEGGLRTVREQT